MNASHSEHADEYVYQRKIALSDIFSVVAARASLAFLLYITYREAEHFNIVFAIVICTFLLLSFAQLLFDRTASITVGQQGVRYQCRPLLFAWHKEWQEISNAYWKDKWFERWIALASSNNQPKQIRINEWVYKGSGTSIPINEAIAKFTPLQAHTKMPKPANLDLGKAAGTVTIYAAILIIISLVSSSLIINRYVTIGDSMPWWPVILSGVLGAAGTAIYLIKQKANVAGVPVISLISAVACAFAFFLTIKSIVILFGSDKLTAFELTEKNGGYQLWQSSQDKNIEIEIGTISGTVWTEAEQGAVRQLMIREGIGSIKLLLPNELDKTEK